ncbi:MAG: MFS transporter, partial [Rhodospirillales bacterium]|nr:MFS transporter [Rhodospirillales bacterium]
MSQTQRRAAPQADSAGLAARAVALDIVSGVLRRGRALDDERPDLNALAVRDRGFARAIAAVTLRRLGQIDAVIAAFVERPIPPRDALATDLLRISLAQLLFLGTPAHAAVDTAVELVRARGKERMAGLVNAVLRRATRDGQGIVAQQDVARINTPDWLWQSWTAAYGEDQARA